jgi:hypothetical protein
VNLSFQEKSLWLMFVGLVAAFGFYFWTVLSAQPSVAAVLPAEAVEVMPHQVVLFALAVVMLVILQVIGHILIAIVDWRSETDERDRLIGLKGTRNAAYVLATGVFLSLCAAVVTRGNFVTAHVLLASWVLAQLVEIGSQLFLYRRGA